MIPILTPLQQNCFIILADSPLIKGQNVTPAFQTLVIVLPFALLVRDVNMAIFTILLTQHSHRQMSVLKNMLNPLPSSDAVTHQSNIFIPLSLLSGACISILMVFYFSLIFMTTADIVRTKFFSSYMITACVFLPCMPSCCQKLNRNK